MWAEIITCHLIIRGDFMEQQHLIHSETQTKSQILLSWDESIGSLIWAQIRPKRKESVFSWRRAKWSHWADVGCSQSGLVSKRDLPLPSWCPSDWMTPLRWSPCRARIQDACVSCDALLKGPSFLLRDLPSRSPPLPSTHPEEDMELNVQARRANVSRKRGKKW